MTVIRCAMCGEPNPDDLEFCQWCEARLKPLSAASPDDLPIQGDGKGIAPQQGGDSEQVVPDWLQALRESAEPASGGNDDENIHNPDQSEEPVASLSGDESAPATHADDKPVPIPDDNEQIPDWLVELRDSAKAPVSQPDEFPSTASLPPLAEADLLTRTAQDCRVIARTS
jgi:hypothetical protein